MKRTPFSSTPNRHLIARTPRSDREQADASAWMSEHRGRKAYAPPPSAGRAAHKLIKPLAKQFSGPSVTELDAHWSAIVGPQLAQYTRPEKFQGGASGSTLVIRARGPAAALAQAQSAQILARVASYSGKHPRKLKIVQGPITNEARAPKAQETRVKKVKALPPEPKTLDETLEIWRKAVEAREGVHVPPLRPHPED